MFSGPNRAQVVDEAVGSLNNLETIDVQAACHQVLTQAEGSVSPELISTAPPESYLAMAQQEWLDLRIHTSSRWRIPGLRCFTKSESWKTDAKWYVYSSIICTAMHMNPVVIWHMHMYKNKLLIVRMVKV